MPPQIPRLSIFVFALFLAHAQAAVVVHYFKNEACNANTAISDYTNPNPAPLVTDCIAAPSGAVALYVDGVDDGCTIRTYTDASCTTNLGLSITVGTCYYKNNTPIGSWRAVCASPASDPTVTMSLMATVGSDTASAPESSTDMATGTAVAPVVTSVETVTPTTMPAANHMGNGSNGTDWNMTHSKLMPTGIPGLQGTGTGARMGSSDAGKSAGLMRVVGILKAFGALVVLAGILM